MPYLPASVDAILQFIEHARVDRESVVVDVGSGLGRVCALIHLLTGAKCIGVESQAELIARALKVEGVAYVHGDAVRSTPDATHYFLYCPFDAQSVERWLNALPRKRPAWIGCVDFPLPRRDWIEEAAAPSAELQLYRLTPASSS